jgi:hypothetical protein
MEGENMSASVAGDTIYARLLEGVTDAEVAEAMGYREDPLPTVAAPEAVPERPAPDWRDVLSPAGYEFIVRWETGGRAYYDQVIKGQPIWPGYASGITIGCGYDLGYHTPVQFSADWSDGLPAAAMTRLDPVVGFRTTEPDREAKVRRAKELVRLLADIVVPWGVAIAQFDGQKLPKLVGDLERALPNLDRLHPHCYGALLSLVFNRGTPFRNPDLRYAEMREICRLMERGTPDTLAGIPAQLRSMKRIWGEGSSLAKRREGEAQLFELGLREVQLPIVPERESVAPESALAEEAPAASDEEPAEEVLPTDDPEAALPEEVEALEAAPGAMLPEAAGLTSQQVRWNDKDDEQPDYRHLDTRLAGTSFELRPDDLDLLIAQNEFALVRADGQEQPLVIFALRGARLSGAGAQTERASIVLHDQRPDHRTFQCVIGVYDQARRLLSAFRASTVPNSFYVHKCYALSQGGTPLGGLTGNILPTGCYVYTVGTHKAGQKGEIRGALRLSKTPSGADTVMVLRSLGDVTYDRMDTWHKCAPADNIHPGQMSQGFSSAGCLTLPGFYSGAGGHTGLWAEFRDALGLQGRATENGRQFSCVLLTGLDAAIAVRLREEGAAGDEARVLQQLGRLRHGSRGERVARLQQRLGLAPDASQLLGPVTREALVRRQVQALGWADGILSPAMDARLGLGVY